MVVPVRDMVLLPVTETVVLADEVSLAEGVVLPVSDPVLVCVLLGDVTSQFTNVPSA